MTLPKRIIPGPISISEAGDSGPMACGLGRGCASSLPRVPRGPPLAVRTSVPEAVLVLAGPAVPPWQTAPSPHVRLGCVTSAPAPRHSAGGLCVPTWPMDSGPERCVSLLSRSRGTYAPQFSLSPPVRVALAGRGLARQAGGSVETGDMGGRRGPPRAPASSSRQKRRRLQGSD